ncbi:MAG TPA: bifunctional serine/threonine-protein kinase/formylglycine-generating enzyme family protein [Polyangiaceae bacterium]
MSTRDPIGIVGTIIAEKYRIERLVGEGGFAVVYRAQHTIWNQPVAIKFFNGLSAVPVDQRDQFKDQFIQEGALLTELSSQTASIVQARDVGTYTSPDGQWMPYMVLEWLDGVALDELLERERAANAPPWPVERVISTLAQVANALDVAHGKGIAHRDIKPANIFVLGNPQQNPTLKVLDFGVAKMMTDNTQLKAAMAKTGMNITSFTPQYGAPEQFSRSYGATGPWTDVFALALVAIEMMTGKVALDGDDLVQLAFSSGNPTRRPTPRNVGLPVSDAIEAVFEKAFAIAPHDRYARAKEFWSALEQAAGIYGEGARVSRTSSEYGATQLAPAVAITGPGPLSGTGPGPRASQANLSSTSSPSTVTAAGAATPGSKTGLIIGGVVGAIAVAAAGFFMMGGKHSAEGKAPPAPASAAAMAAAPAPSASAPARVTCPEDMVQIPAGQFFMGSELKTAADNQKPLHNVKVDSVCMDLYEVTAKKYKACSDVGKCRRAPTEVEWPKITDGDRKLYSELCTGANPEKQDHPINCVTWQMADTYCKANDKRLPTEAEWEYATRGPDGRVYPWGDDPPTAQHLNACDEQCVAWGKAHHVPELTPMDKGDDGYATTAPVGKFPAGRSRFGPFDVVGNVGEWVADWYGPYTADAQVNPGGPATGERKVIRGGAWNATDETWLHPAFRYATVPTAQSHGIGFRCVKSITQ